MRSREILQNHFGYADFRPGQAEIVESIATGHDTLTLLSTGGGKSICFQVPALMMPGTTVVISPLISLMTDQVQALHKKDISAAYLASTLSVTATAQIMAQFSSGQLKLLYVSPEKFCALDWATLSQKVTISQVVIDEAHCVVTWGEDFRPVYRQLASQIANFHHRPVVSAFTATATPTTQREIIKWLQLLQPHVHAHSSRRTNLTIIVQHTWTVALKELSLWHILHHHLKDAGIIYCATRAACEELTVKVRREFPQIHVEYYHAGRSGEERSAIQDRYLKGELQWLVSTNAFGMGVDKSDIRFVVHYQPSTSIENYFQEIGRAGRDGRPSWCYLLWRDADWLILAELLEHQDQHITLKRHTILKQLILFAQRSKCRHAQLLKYFGETASQKNCHSCDVCTNWSLPMLPEEKLILQRLELIRDRWTAKLPLIQQHLEQIAYYQPKIREDFTHIPGIGQGWLEVWWPILQPLLDRLYLPLDADTAHRPQSHGHDSSLACQWPRSPTP